MATLVQMGHAPTCEIEVGERTLGDLMPWTPRTGDNWKPQRRLGDPAIANVDGRLTWKNAARSEVEIDWCRFSFFFGVPGTQPRGEPEQGKQPVTIGYADALAEQVRATSTRAVSRLFWTAMAAILLLTIVNWLKG